MKLRVAVGVATLACLVGCQVPDYAKQESSASMIGSSLVRYGTIAGAGVGGFFLGRELTGSDWGGAAASGLAAAATWGIHRFFDWGNEKAYQAGREAGAEAARAEWLRNEWQTKAVERPGAPTEFTVRRVFVQEREINGVKYPAGFQTVQVAN